MMNLINLGNGEKGRPVSTVHRHLTGRTNPLRFELSARTHQPLQATRILNKCSAHCFLLSPPPLSPSRWHRASCSINSGTLSLSFLWPISLSNSMNLPLPSPPLFLISLPKNTSVGRSRMAETVVQPEFSLHRHYDTGIIVTDHSIHLQEKFLFHDTAAFYITLPTTNPLPTNYLSSTTHTMAIIHVYKVPRDTPQSGHLCVLDAKSQNIFSIFTL